MEKIFEKLSLYELFAYFVPGSIFAAVSWIIFNFYGVNLKSFFIYKNPLIDTILIVFGSYFLGIVIHEIGEIIQIILKFIWRGFPSKRFMDISSKIFVNEKEIEQYCEMAKNKFAIEIETKDDADLFFNRTRCFLKDDDTYNDAEIINNSYGMYRSFLAMSVIYFVGFAINFFFNMHKVNFYIVLFWGVIVYILARRLKRFGETYVKKVMRAGYAKFKKEG